MGLGKRGMRIIVFLLLLTGCAVKEESSVKDILTETKTKKVRTVSCPEFTIKVCDGPNKKTIAKYEDVYCSCHSRRDVELALKQRMMEIN